MSRLLKDRLVTKLNPMGIWERMFISDGYASLLESVGLSDYQSFLDFEQGERVSEVRDRIVYRVENPEERGPAFYLKIYRTPGGNRPLNQLSRMERPGTLAEKEAMNLEWLNHHGILSPKMLAWGGRMKGWTEVNSFLVTEELTGLIPLDDWIEKSRRENTPGDWRKLKNKRTFQCATLLRELHELGFHHPFPYLRHFFVSRQTSGSLTPPADSQRVAIIDVDSARISRTVSDRYRARGLAELLLSSFRSPLSQTDRLRFFQIYCGGEIDRSLLQKTLHRFRQKIHRHPNRYAWVRQRLEDLPFPAQFKDRMLETKWLSLM